MRVIVAGGRDFSDFSYLKRTLDTIEAGLGDNDLFHLVSGTARGADRLAEKWATEKGLCISSFPADWNTHGKSAGYKRNVEMAENADALVAFWDGMSKGTQHMINIASKKKLLVQVFNYEY